MKTLKVLIFLFTLLLTGRNVNAQLSNTPVVINHTEILWSSTAYTLTSLSYYSPLVVVADVKEILPAKLLLVPNPLAGFPDREFVVQDTVVEVQNVIRVQENLKIQKGSLITVRRLGGTILTSLPSKQLQLVSFTQDSKDAAQFNKGETILLFLHQRGKLRKTGEDIWNVTNMAYGKFNQQEDGSYLRNFVLNPKNEIRMRISLPSLISVLITVPYDQKLSQ